jgi:hypothetical protein
MMEGQVVALLVHTVLVRVAWCWWCWSSGARADALAHRLSEHA